jgi:CelD/BcsL family acetyltransferase involved in cellulose biosynthesis
MRAPLWSPAAAVPARAAGPAPYRVQACAGREAFAALRAEWDALLARGPTDLPFLRHAVLEAWLDAFAPAGARLVVLCARDPGGEAVGFAPLLSTRRGGVVRLAAPANDHSCRAEWVLGRDASGAVAALWAHLRDAERWDVLVLRDLPRDGPTSTLLEPLARADGHLTGRWESQRSPWLALSAGWTEGRVSAKFRANLRRRRKRLEELGPVAYRAEDGAGDLGATLDAFFALEAAGWKGRGGTALAGDPRLVRFYRTWAREAAGRGALAIRALVLSGRPVAMHLGLVHGGAYYLPKTAYDEALGAVSPGQLLHREVVAECQARGLRELDFLGPDMDWKRDWAPEHRPHDWLYVYRPSLSGRALHALKHRVKPAAREVLRWRS